MPLNNLFTYLFENDEGDFQFFYVVDKLSPIKSTVYQEKNMELETNLKPDTGRKKVLLKS